MLLLVGCGQGFLRPVTEENPIVATPLPTTQGLHYAYDAEGGARVWWPENAHQIRATVSTEVILSQDGTLVEGDFQHGPFLFDGAEGFRVGAALDAERIPGGALSVLLEAQMDPSEPWQAVGAVDLGVVQVALTQTSSDAAVYLALMSNGQLRRRVGESGPWSTVIGAAGWTRFDTSVGLVVHQRSGCGLLEGRREMVCWGVPYSPWTHGVERFEESPPVALTLDAPATSIHVGPQGAIVFNDDQNLGFGRIPKRLASGRNPTFRAVEGPVKQAEFRLPDRFRLKETLVTKALRCIVGDTDGMEGQLLCWEDGWQTPPGFGALQVSGLRLVSEPNYDASDPVGCVNIGPVEDGRTACLQPSSDGIRQRNLSAFFEDASSVLGDHQLACRGLDRFNGEDGIVHCGGAPFGTTGEPVALDLGQGRRLERLQVAKSIGDDDRWRNRVCARLEGALYRCVRVERNRGRGTRMRLVDAEYLRPF